MQYIYLYAMEEVSVDGSQFNVDSKETSEVLLISIHR